MANPQLTDPLVLPIDGKGYRCGTATVGSYNYTSHINVWWYHGTLPISRAYLTPEEYPARSTELLTMLLLDLPIPRGWPKPA
jgi:hypothetical protein